MELHCAYNQLVCVSDLKPHPKNPNTHSAAQVAAIAAVIEGNRSRAPITVSNRSGFITRGHGRLEAAALLGCDQFPVDFQDYASEEAELADNHLAELAEIDEDRLVGVLKELQAAGHDVGLAGFTEDEVARLIAVEEEIAQLEPIPKMELQAFEHYDYLVFMFKDIRDWLRVLQLLKVVKVDFSISRKSQKIGIGRVINELKICRVRGPPHSARSHERRPCRRLALLDLRPSLPRKVRAVPMGLLLPPGNGPVRPAAPAPRHFLLKPLLGVAAGRTPSSGSKCFQRQPMPTGHKTKLEAELELWDFSGVDEYWEKIQRNARIVKGSAE